MSSNPKDFVSQIFSMPYGDMIASVGEGVANAQRALDEGSLAATLELYDTRAEEGSVHEILQAIGYQPQTYALRNVKGHLKMAMSFQAEESGPRLWAMPMNPVVTGKYNYNAQASSELSFEIVPLPPAEQIRKLPEFSGRSVKGIREDVERLGLEAIFLDEKSGKQLENNQSTDAYKYVSHSPGASIVNIDQLLEFRVKP